MRDWVIALILLLILVIVFDGIRRWQKTRRENIQLSRNAKRADKEYGNDGKGLPSEFPSGGARVAKQRAPEDAVSVNSSLRESFESSKLTAGARNRIPQQVTLKLDEAVPELNTQSNTKKAREQGSVQLEPTIHANTLEELEHVDEQESVPTKGKRSRNKAGKREQSAGVQTSFWGQRDEAQGAGTASSGSELSQHEIQSSSQSEDERGEEPSALGKEPLASYKKPLAAAADVEEASSEAMQSVPEEQLELEVEAAGPHSVSGGETSRVESPQPIEPKQEEEFIEPEEVLIINVAARRGELFQGPDLLSALMELNMKFGEMNIFHRHVNDDGSGPVLFSLANMVMPGTFNLAAMQSFSTPGLSMFLSLPLPSSLEEMSESVSLDAYNILAYTAQGLARALDGQLKDENRSVMTLQTIEHGRQRVIEYQRKRRLAQR